MTRWMKCGVCSLVLGSFGCSDPKFDHLQYSNVSDAPGTADLRPREIQIAKGIAVRASVSAIDDNGDTMDLRALTSSRSQIFRIDLGPAAGQFVFSGVEVGTAELDVDAEGRVTSLPVEVVSPE